MNCQTVETASELITTGRKKIARSSPRALSVRWSASASASPMTLAVMTNAKASLIAFSSAPREAGSSRIWRKLSSPTQVASLRPSQSVNAYQVPAPVAIAERSDDRDGRDHSRATGRSSGPPTTGACDWL